MHRVIVKNLDSALVSVNKLLEEFHRRGLSQVRQEDIHISRKGPCTAGKMCTAFVTLTCNEEIQTAVDALSGQQLCHLSTKPLFVTKAVPRVKDCQAHMEKDLEGRALCDPYLDTSTKSRDFDPSAEAQGIAQSTASSSGLVKEEDTELPKLRVFVRQDRKEDSKKKKSKRSRSRSRRQHRRRRPTEKEDDEDDEPPLPPWQRRQSMRDNMPKEANQ